MKIIGATAHYVTEELDAGPIIEQDVVRVSHRDDVERARRGSARDIERTVLARAVDWHCEDRVLVHGNTHRRLLTRHSSACAAAQRQAQVTRRRLGPVGSVQLAKDVLDMELDRPFGDDEFLGDA